MGGLAEFGILPIILRYCKECNERLTDAYKTPVRLILYIVSYEILLDKKQKEEYDKLTKKMRRR